MQDVIPELNDVIPAHDCSRHFDGLLIRQPDRQREAHRSPLFLLVSLRLDPARFALDANTVLTLAERGRGLTMEVRGSTEDQ